MPKRVGCRVKLVRMMIVAACGVALAAGCDKQAASGGAESAAVEPAAVAAGVEGATSAVSADEAPQEAPVDQAPGVAAGGDYDDACPFDGDKAACGDSGCGSDCGSDCASACGQAKQAAAHAHAHGEHLGCGGAPVEAAAPSVEERASEHFGAPFTLADAAPLATVLAGLGEGSDEPVLVSGTIHQVCQKKGCWMVVRDGEAEVRVTMKDYGFFVPMDAQGKATVVEGTLAPRTFTEAQARHLAEDAGEDPSKVEGEVREYVLTASGITIRS